MTQSSNLVFCGTPRFAVPTLDRLVEAGFKVQLVVTQPDRPQGRGLELVFSPIKERALQLGLPISQPESIKNNDAFRAELTALKPEAIIVVGYGRIIPQWMRDLPPHGNINLHASLLPKYRGAAPIQWTIARGETITGVTTMKIDAGLDTGDILLQQEMVIAPDDTAETVANWQCAATPARSGRSHASAHPQKRRRPRRFLSSWHRDTEPHARLSALARRIFKVSRQESANMASGCDRAGSAIV